MKLIEHTCLAQTYNRPIPKLELFGKFLRTLAKLQEDEQEYFQEISCKAFVKGSRDWIQVLSAE